jgi:hypothetical protein
MGKFFSELPPVPSLTDDTLFAVSEDTTIKTYKTTLGEIGSHIRATPSGAEARMSSELVLTSGIPYYIPFDTKRYDIEGTEFDIVEYAFEPITAGLYLTTVTVGLSGSPSWSSGDRVVLFILTGDISNGTTWNSSFYEFSAPTSGDMILTCAGVVKVDPPSGVQIRGGITSDFLGGALTRTVEDSWPLVGTTTGYSNIQVTRV